MLIFTSLRLLSLKKLFGFLQFLIALSGIQVEPLHHMILLVKSFFRNSGIDFLGGFGENLGVSAYFAKLYMKSIEIAFAMDWSNL